MPTVANAVPPNTPRHMRAIVSTSATLCLTLMTSSRSGRRSTLCLADEPLLDEWAQCDDGRVTGRLADGTVVWMRPSAGSPPPTAGGPTFTSSGGRHFLLGAPRQEEAQTVVWLTSPLKQLESMLPPTPAVVVRRWLEGDEAPPGIARALRERDEGFKRVAVFSALAAYALGIFIGSEVF